MRSLLLVTLLAALGCFPDPHCDADQLVIDNVCVAVPTASADAAPRADASGDAGPTVESSFGRACATVDECGADTDLCAQLPGAATGSCTRAGCLADTSVCPPTWTCFDASAYVAGMSLCLQL